MPRVNEVDVAQLLVQHVVIDRVNHPRERSGAGMRPEKVESCAEAAFMRGSCGPRATEGSRPLGAAQSRAERNAAQAFNAASVRPETTEIRSQGKAARMSAAVFKAASRLSWQVTTVPPSDLRKTTLWMWSAGAPAPGPAGS